jgi:glycosyltransferase involved in cell wall biosynthesis
LTDICVAPVLQYFALGGLERMVEGLALGAREHGVRSVVIGYLGDGPIRQSLEAAGVHTHLLADAPGFSPFRIHALQRILRSERVEVVHTHHLGPFVYGASAAFARGLPVVHTEHSHELYDVARRRMLARAMPLVSEVVAVTAEIASYRARHFGRSCRVIENGVQLPVLVAGARARARTLLGVGEEELVIGCIARLAAEKDHDTLLQAFALLSRRVPKARLVLIGTGPLERAIRERCGSLGLGDRVRLLGARNDVGELLSGLDVVALTSVREGLPLSLLEAMAHGRAVLATQVGGIVELLAEGAGRLVAPGDVHACADELENLARDPALRAALGARAHARVAARYSEARMISAYVELYRELRAQADSSMREETCASFN